MTNDELVVAARQHLTTLGYVEASGEYRRAPTGELQPAYQISALGHIAKQYMDTGSTLEEAMALVRSSPS